MKGLRAWVAGLTGRDDLPQLDDDVDQADAIDLVDNYVDGWYAEKSERLGGEVMQALSAQVMLRVIDTRWMDYLQEMDYLKTGIGLRGFGWRDPLAEYKDEAYAAFINLVDTINEDFLRTILRIKIAGGEAAGEGPGDDGAPASRAAGSGGGGGQAPGLGATPDDRLRGARRPCRPPDRRPSTASLTTLTPTWAWVATTPAPAPIGDQLLQLSRHYPTAVARSSSTATESPLGKH